MADENRNDNDEPMFEDKRRVDPETGEVRGKAGAGDSSADAVAEPGDSAGEATSAVTDEELEQLIADARAAEAAGEAPDAGPADEAPVADDAAEEQSADAARADATLADLQRVTAEYANYRRRTDQEKIAAKDANTADVLRSLLPVLDDLDRAEQHGDLPEDGALTVIANKLRETLERLGLVAYGEKGDAFDPNVHEAIAQLPNPEVESETVGDVVERGYRVGERVVRVAKVAVFVPAS